MRLSEEYNNEIIENLSFFKESGKPLKLTVASGESFNLFVARINKRDNKIELGNVITGGKFITSFTNIVSIYSADRSVMVDTLGHKVSINKMEQPKLPNTGVDFFEVCRAASLARKSIRVSVVTGEHYTGSVLGLNRYSVGLTELQDLRGKIDIYFDWVTAIEVL